jgi:hypothetical protein
VLLSAIIISSLPSRGSLIESGRVTKILGIGVVFEQLLNIIAERKIIADKIAKDLFFFFMAGQVYVCFNTAI